MDEYMVTVASIYFTLKIVKYITRGSLYSENNTSENIDDNDMINGMAMNMFNTFLSVMNKKTN